MLQRLEREEAALASQLRTETSAAEPIVTEVSHAENDAAGLPHDHPRWIKDAAAVSRAARSIVARLRPIAIRVFTFWDHRFRTIAVAGCRLEVDASGSYHLPT
ncbi:MAG: hypothetical protein JO199_02705 [Candidatus Eremiobacteraeota bacterium]|nr:hypothetical protein [Candidatus Eremiobacteraeota bacterium]